jgi:hypothetical protein
MTIISSYGKGLYLGNLSSLSPKSKVKDFIQDNFFLGKYLLYYLNLDCLL